MYTSIKIALSSWQNIHGSFMRTVAPYADQTKVWARLLDHWQFRSVVMIHSSDAEGRAMLGGIQGAAESSKHLQVSYWGNVFNILHINSISLLSKQSLLLNICMMYSYERLCWNKR